MKSIFRKDGSAGMSIFQVAFVVSLAGIFASIAIQIYKTSLLFQSEQITLERLSKIELAMNVYIQRNGFAPCAASRTQGIDSAGYGLSIPDCTVAAAGTQSVSGAGGMARLGAVPTRTLNLPDDHMYDGWGNQLTFAISENLAINPATYSANDGSIIVQTHDGGVLEGNAMYAVVSHGPDTAGAFNRLGIVDLACDPSVNDGENCNNDSIFRTSFNLVGNDEVSQYSRADASQHHDDYMTYSAKQNIVFSVVRSYSFNELPCDPAHGGIEQNPNGEDCATLSFTALNDRGYGISIGDGFAPNAWQIGCIDASSGCGGANGKLLYSTNWEATTNGQALIRATVPVRYDNWLANIVPKTTMDPFVYNDPDNRILQWGQGYDSELENMRDWTTPPGVWDMYWELAMLIAIYVDGDLIVIGDLINPSSFYSTIGNHLWTDSLGGTGSVIGEFFTEEGRIYNIEIYIFSVQAFDVKNVCCWAGTIRMQDYDAAGYIEFMELGAI